jgi:hypothetical protein
VAAVRVEMWCPGRDRVAVIVRKVDDLGRDVSVIVTVAQLHVRSASTMRSTS